MHSLGISNWLLTTNGGNILERICRGLWVLLDLLVSPPPDADHVVASDGHHVVIIMTTRYLQSKRHVNMYQECLLSDL